MHSILECTLGKKLMDCLTSGKLRLLYFHGTNRMVVECVFKITMHMYACFDCRRNSLISLLAWRSTNSFIIGSETRSKQKIYSSCYKIHDFSVISYMIPT